MVLGESLKGYNTHFKYFLNLDSVTKRHSYKVTRYSCKLAHALGMKNEYITHIYISALLHDIGKSKVPTSILNKPQKLTTDEWHIIRQHPQIGSDILNKLGLSTVANTIISHHEHFDGRGYPFGLKGNEIPLPARIINIADAFDAMIAKRPYRDRMSIQQALQELIDCSGTQFDPKLVKIFVSLF